MKTKNSRHIWYSDFESHGQTPPPPGPDSGVLYRFQGRCACWERRIIQPISPRRHRHWRLRGSLRKWSQSGLRACVRRQLVQYVLYNDRGRPKFQWTSPVLWQVSFVQWGGPQHISELRHLAVSDGVRSLPARQLQPRHQPDVSQHHNAGHHFSSYLYILYKLVYLQLASKFSLAPKTMYMMTIFKFSADTWKYFTPPTPSYLLLCRPP